MRPDSLKTAGNQLVSFDRVLFLDECLKARALWLEEVL